MVRSVPFRIGSALSIETRSGTLAGQRRMELLSAIGSRHSIAAAARKVGITYKAAWDAVETMNNLAGVPLVERSVGGRGGGGARLTGRGEELVRVFESATRRNAQFLDALNAGAADMKDSKVLSQLALTTSARNQLGGRIARIEKGAVNDLIELEVHGGSRITAIVTQESRQSLGLRPKMDAVALVKASSVIVAAGANTKLKMSARNQLAGRVLRVVRGAVNSEVVLEIAGGLTIAAIITNASVRKLGLAKGKPATAVFKASSVILAVPG
jgi:molybdate transport system regulatory protein